MANTTENIMEVSMKNKVIRKIVVSFVSVLIVSSIVGGIVALNEAKEQAALEASYTEAKPVMTQEEMEALYDEHKKDREAEKGNDDISLKEDVSENSISESNSLEEGALENSSLERQEKKEETEGGIDTECPVDFEGMWEINKDVYAWITIPGTVIDYPILQHETDNTYYLNYNIDGSYGYPGCIYTENMNSRDFTDNNTVIYGHNMKNGTMFAELHKFEDTSFFEEHTKIYIYTPEKELDYTIFAAYIYDDRHLMYSFDFADSQVYAAYLEDIRSMRSMNALFREDITVTAEDKIITLSTCIGNQPDKRLLVQAVLDEGTDSMEE